ncbi:MAG TPA: aldehyde dehydrogenase family protein [Actinomycetota bacterium]|nr:aldehyde dehydrogenase family protein [Actinomycetota bacterium]
MREYGLFIDGEFVDAASGETFETHDPSTSEVVARVARAGAEDVDRAMAAARRAFDEGPWARLSPQERTRIMLRVYERLQEAAGDLADLEMRDAGQTIRAASLFLIPYSTEFWGYLAEAASRISYVEQVPRFDFPTPAWEWVQREPFGVCAQIIPWNVPYMMAIWKIAPAIATGNTIVLKPAPETPVTAMELARIIQESDIPPGVVNILPGPGVPTGEAMVTDPRVDKVAFTGSTEVGRRIMQLCAPMITYATLELGGKGPNVLLDDADLDVAVPGALWAMYLHQGQICQAGTRLLVPSSLYDEVVARVVDLVEGFTTGSAHDHDSDLGPVVNRAQLERIERYIELGRREGAKLLTGGERLTGGIYGRGWYVQPTVFGDVDNSMKIAQEEIFGPVLSIIRYDGVDEAVRIANDSPYGLAAGVWSRDIPRALQVVNRLRAGTVWVNDFHLISPAAPFGGYKQSGIGREHGEWGLKNYLEVKTVHVNQVPTRDQKFWYQVLGL